EEACANGLHDSRTQWTRICCPVRGQSRLPRLLGWLSATADQRSILRECERPEIAVNQRVANLSRCLALESMAMSHTFLARAAFLLLILSSSISFAQSNNAEQSRWRREAQSVTIIRDDWGIAHIVGNTDGDAVL